MKSKWKTSAMWDIIAYTYEADYHCPECTEYRFRIVNGIEDEEEWIDNEGNPVSPVFEDQAHNYLWTTQSEWEEYGAPVYIDGGEPEAPSLSCGTCRRDILKMVKIQDVEDVFENGEWIEKPTIEWEIEEGDDPYWPYKNLIERGQKVDAQNMSPEQYDEMQQEQRRENIRNKWNVNKRDERGRLKWTAVDWRIYAQRLLNALEINNEYDVGTLVNELKRLRTGNPADSIDILYTEAREALDSLAFDNYGAIEDIIDDLRQMLYRRTASEAYDYQEDDDGSYYIPGFYAAIRGFNGDEELDPRLNEKDRLTAFHYLPHAQHYDVFSDLVSQHPRASELDDFRRAVFNPTTKQLALLSYHPNDPYWDEEKRKWMGAAREAGVDISEFGSIKRTDDPYRAGGWLDYDFVPEPKR